MVNRAVAISILIVVLCVGGLFVYFKFGEPTLIEKDPSTMVLMSEDVAYPLYLSGYLSISEAAEAGLVSEYQLEQWGYERGYVTYFAEEGELMVASGTLRFSSIGGAKSAFDAICSAHGLEYDVVASPKFGDESYAYRYYPAGEEVYIIFFRKANIFVDVEARTLSATKTYAQIIEEKI